MPVFLLLKSQAFAISFFTYWLRIHKLCLKTRVVLQILSHKARHKIPVKCEVVHFLVHLQASGLRIYLK